MKQKGKKQNFSMFEVLVVITLVGILASLIFSSMSMAREEAKRTICLNNLKQIQTVVEAFRKDHRTVPHAHTLGDLSFAGDYVDEGDFGIFMCPGDYEASMTHMDDLFGGSSYFYIPTEEIASRMLGMEDAIDHYLVLYDKNKKFHGGKFNILYLHGSPGSHGGIAETYNAYTTEDSDPDEDDDPVPFEGEGRNNHGHGNNVDGVDSSNPAYDNSNGKGGVDPKDDSDPNVDDEKKIGNGKNK